MAEPILIENAVRGQEIKDYISVTNSENSETAIRLSAGGQIADWVTFYSVDDNDLTTPIEEIMVPAQNQKRAFVKFSLPADLANGTYTGLLTVSTKPASPTQSNKKVNVSMAQSIDREVTIKVTGKEIVKLDAVVFAEKNKIAIGTPLNIKVIYNNQGNIALKPDLQLKITEISSSKIVNNAIYLFPETEKPIRALEERTIDNIVQWQTAGQQLGRYQADVKVSLGKDVVKEEKFQFDIVNSEAATVMGANTAKVVENGASNETTIWYMLALSVAMAVIFLAVKFLKKNKTNISNS